VDFWKHCKSGFWPADLTLLFSSGPTGFSGEIRPSRRNFLPPSLPPFCPPFFVPILTNRSCSAGDLKSPCKARAFLQHVFLPFRIRGLGMIDFSRPEHALGPLASVLPSLLPPVSFFRRPSRVHPPSLRWSAGLAPVSRMCQSWRVPFTSIPFPLSALVLLGPGW